VFSAGQRADARQRRSSTQHFGGSTYLQVAVEAELVTRRAEDGQAVARRADRAAGDPRHRRARPGDPRRRRRAVVVEPVMLLNEALGGRNGIPETAGRGGRVLTYLQGHPAVAQLMTADAGGRAGPRQAGADERAKSKCASPTTCSRSIARTSGGMLVGEHRADPQGARRIQIAEVGEHLTRLAGKPVDAALLADLAAPKTPRRRCWPRCGGPRPGARLRGQPGRGGAAGRDRQRSIREPASPRAARRSRPCCARSCRRWRPRTPRASASWPSTWGRGSTRCSAKFRVEGRCRGCSACRGEAARRSSTALSELDDAEWRMTSRARAGRWRATTAHRSAGDRGRVRGVGDAQPVRVDAGVGGRAGADAAAGASSCGR
jgi:hypothetical protein